MKSCTSISSKHFVDILEAITDIIHDRTLLSRFVKLEDPEEVYKFVKISHPGDYTKEDFAKFVFSVCNYVYIHSRKYASSAIFNNTIEDIKKNGGPDFLGILEKFKKEEAEPVSLDDLDISGGANERKWSKIVAGSLAALVPVTSLGNQMSSVHASAYGNDYEDYDYGNSSNTRLKKGKKTSKEDENKSWFQKFRETKTYTFLKWGTILLGTAAIIYGANKLYGNYQDNCIRQKMKEDSGIDGDATKENIVQHFVMEDCKKEYIKTAKSIKENTEDKKFNANNTLEQLQLNNNYAFKDVKNVDDFTNKMENYENINKSSLISIVNNLVKEDEQRKAKIEKENEDKDEKVEYKPTEIATYLEKCKLSGNEFFKDIKNIKLENIPEEEKIQFNNNVHDYQINQLKEKINEYKNIDEIFQSYSKAGYKNIQNAAKEEYNKAFDAAKSAGGSSSGKIGAAAGFFKDLFTIISAPLTWVIAKGDDFMGFMEKVGKAAETPGKIIDQQRKIGEEWIRRAYERSAATGTKKSVVMAGMIANYLKSIIKGQDEQMDCLASILGSFNMQAEMQDEDESVIDSPQLNSQCVFLAGPSGTGKSMVTGLVKNLVGGNVRYITLNLSNYDGSTDVNTYLTKQAEFRNNSYGLEGKRAVIAIEEIDKVSKNPVARDKINHWLHTVYDTGRIGGGEKESPIQLSGTLFLITSNELPSPELLINGKVKGLNVESEGETFDSSNSSNYIDILRELTKNTSRESPVERTGSLISRSTFIEFKQTNDDAMKDIIDMHLSALNERFEEYGININYSEKFIEKLAQLRHTSMYKDGGSRTIINDILKPIFADITEKIGAIADDDDDVTQVWLDYGGVDSSNKLIVNIKRTEEEATCDGEDPEFEDEEVVATRKPELEAYIQSLMLKELGEVLVSLRTAYNSGVVDDWSKVLNTNNMDFIKQLASMSSANVPSSVNDQIKTILMNHEKIVDSVGKIGISDSQWKSIKKLRETIKLKAKGKVENKKNMEKSKQSMAILENVLSDISKVNNQMNAMDQKSSFVQSNKSVISQIFSMLNDKENDYDFEEQFDFLMENRGKFDSNLVLSSKQRSTIDKFKNAISKQVKKIEDMNAERTHEIGEIFSDISNIRNSHPDLRFSDALNSADFSFLSSLVSIIDPSKSISDNEERIEFICKNKDKLVANMSNSGISDTQLRFARALKSSIENWANEKSEDQGKQDQNSEENDNQNKIDLQDEREEIEVK